MRDPIHLSTNSKGKSWDGFEISFDVQYKASAQNDTDDYKLQTNDIVVVFTLQLI